MVGVWSRGWAWSWARKEQKAAYVRENDLPQMEQRCGLKLVIQAIVVSFARSALEEPLVVCTCIGRAAPRNFDGAHPPLTPVYFFSHGSTMMLGEESESATYWKKAGDEALANNIKGVIMMGAHWDAPGDEVHVATNPNPSKSPVAYVHPSKYVDYKLNPDLPTAERCVSLLKKAGFAASGDATFDWIHDTYLILIRMFPAGCPPTTLISANERYDPHFHMKLGAALRPLRKENYLIIGSGGAVHNLYRNHWMPMLRFSDNFAQERPPESWALEFRQAVEDVIRE
ncbi:hypothetical protein CHGG_00056 [Chaetomium globosum CBS 148.51]|uniref:Extradiol ring-cleavage dioxygenase class III enzyme subunit B domain-containing protein n=1 Tax=Chaetomium globosum (strain ATCC 6205 / CBS 148.51 / DSM 1962 / NBRC 6347 / NRRL 1970) TaxID=306901 RepID=Q2HI98_CHAGB|nr:uncharacterized protein CHGG_00056 [Chaetomium globosum CBS 148.51]EAQ91821.1 hypothetical protein CHGG_00056 [Chaetomium globosum CBS 148.51]